VLSGLAWIRAARDDSARWYAIAGLLLAGAVLSKYFAAILGFAYLVDALRRRRAGASGRCRHRLRLHPAGAGADGLVEQRPLLAELHVQFRQSPRRCRLVAEDAAALCRDPDLRAGAAGALAGAEESPSRQRRLLAPALGTLAWLPFLLFALLSGVKQIGLHWLLSFVPFTLIWLTLRLPPATLQKLGLFFAGFATLHIAAILVVSRLPLETWQKARQYDGIVLTFEHQALARELEAYKKDWVLAMDGYSNAVTLGYNLRQYVAVFGEASSHARHDDLVTDFRALAGRNFLILRKSEPAADDYRRYFRTVTVDSFEVRGARFWRVKGEGFDYAAYREGGAGRGARQVLCDSDLVAATGLLHVRSIFSG
jgi:hypothetical protein